MPTTRCSTSVLTSCSTSSGVRTSLKHAAKRAVSRIVRSVFAQQQCTGIRCDRSTIERHHHLAPFNRCKFEQRRVTFCQHRGTPLLRQKPLLQQLTFADSESSVAPTQCEICGARVQASPSALVTDRDDLTAVVGRGLDELKALLTEFKIV